MNNPPQVFVERLQKGLGGVARARYGDFMDDGFFGIAGTNLFENLVLEGYGVEILEDSDGVSDIITVDESFRGFRKYPPQVVETIRETALENLNTLMVAELPMENEG